MSLSLLLKNSSDRWPEKTAVWFAGRGWTFAQLDDASSRICAALAAAGAKAGDRIALFTPNCIELVLGYFGIFKLGGIAVPLNDRYLADEAEYALKHSGVTTLIVHEEKLDAVASLPWQVLGISRRYQIGGRARSPFRSFESLLGETAVKFSPPASAEHQPAAILYTSGSTARRKV